ncbi:serine hydrolase domain-containing protein [Actinomadura rubrisoli]|nr:serine hydrolase domain-containing protein [Actinomadura rubrisoli]
MDAAVRDGVPGVVAVAEQGRRVWGGRSGVADLVSGRKRGVHDRFRVGSITKTFVAAVVLQMAAEGKLSLDDTVDHWLPGVVKGNGHDGKRIRLRQVLNHTGGIYSYTEDEGFQRQEFGTDFLRHRYDTWTPERIVRLAMTHKPDFAPGDGWHYSDTDYVLVGMVIKKAGGRSYADEIERRILRPLRLSATTLPGTSARMPKPSGRAYSKLTGSLSGPGEAGRPTYDVTEFNPSLAGAAGEIVSSASDLNRFYRALLSGRLLKPRQFKEMTTGVPVVPGFSYGLGLMKLKLSCGTEVWGHSGGIQGSVSESLVAADGGRAVTSNFNGDWGGRIRPVAEAEFCRD